MLIPPQLSVCLARRLCCCRTGLRRVVPPAACGTVLVSALQTGRRLGGDAAPLFLCVPRSLTEAGCWCAADDGHGALCRSCGLCSGERLCTGGSSAGRLAAQGQPDDSQSGEATQSTRPASDV